MDEAIGYAARGGAQQIVLFVMRGSIMASRISTIMLANPYYKGSVRYQGVTYAGVPEAIVSNEVWDQVQTVLGTHRSAADATQVHEHYLKGTVFCRQCGSGLLVCNAKSSQGTLYPYFVCASRHGGRSNCTRQAMLIEQVERLIERFYAKVQIDSETIEAVSARIHARFDETMAERPPSSPTSYPGEPSSKASSRSCSRATTLLRERTSMTP